ncbi:MAG TPA: four helix bundle protein [Chitinophagaceae bacterium]|nr:four helix bundle protein [Chitinophagaceae bacterium]HNF29357.1 four helix bundle protein [Chitinophagaceae bacterium]HNJ57663.1 four helix bundle protein [Chitinophagaceae bacterium]HNM34622.1 four helix bundle protein [Chitinophagaceae bacterium]
MSDLKKTDSIIQQKSYAFALAVIALYKNLVTDKKEFVLSKQVLRSGTSIGANIQEAVASQSKRDFIHKLSISLKEARETQYWLNLLKDSSYIPESEFNNLNNSCDEVKKILTSIILTTKERYLSNS